jgi:preprotein translocase subunit SecE
MSDSRAQGSQADEPRRGFNPVAFVREVRAESRKITWTSRQETTLSTIMVFIMVLIAGIFFFFADFTIRSLVSWALEFAR